MPVPLHFWRQWRRGFNQAALIARGVSRRTAVPTALEALRRMRATPMLRALGRAERARVVAQAFAPGRAIAAVAGRRVLLVDDVYTSGATARACAALLKAAGAQRVEILCWARVLDPPGD